MKLAVLGCGSIGSVVAKFLSEDFRGADIVVLDKFTDSCKNRLSRLGTNSVCVDYVDAGDLSALASRLKGYDLVIDSLPGYLGFNAMLASIKACVDLVSISYMPQDPMELSEEAANADITIVPDAGLAPGLSNVLAGRILSILRDVDEIGIYVGGLPKENISPLGYVITWSAVDLLEEYVRPARVIIDGGVRYIDPLSSTEKVHIEGLGEFEGFYSDGLRTLLHTLKGKVRRAYEVTLRYPGHLSKIRILKELGFLDDEKIALDNASVSPKEFTAKVLERKLRKEGIKDLVILKVVGKNKLGSRIEYSLVEEGSEHTYAMARTTAAPAVATALLVAEGELSKGVIPPEYIGMNTELFSKFMNYLNKKQIKIKMNFEERT